ncbi:MAG: LysR family transcriptional regulator [Hyphomicrobiales bacterium]|nr:LysR family transcriptional regulator [Hyphomicrobiales bacterium]MDE2114460.1 LysR family transcriptional regulator [Hyphomicrobiales bacterium]
MTTLDWPALAGMQTDVRHWRAFVAVAETLHFHAAAERLGISQPALSQLVRALEKNLGVRLFDRQGRRVALSPAGQALLPQAKLALHQLQRTENVGRAFSRREARALAVGYVGSAAFHPSFAALVGSVNTLVPEMTLILNQLPATQQIESLVAQTLDFAVIRSPLPELDPSLALLPGHKEPMVLALPDSHARAKEPVCQLKDFANEPFIQYIHQRDGGLRRLVEAACHAAGFEPRIAHTVPQIATMLCLVSVGSGVALVPKSMKRLAMAGIVYLELGEPVSTELTFVYRRSDTSPPLRAVLQLARGTIDKHSFSK